MPSTMDKYKQGFQLGQSILGQRRQRSMEEERLGISRGHLSIAQQKLWNLMNEPPESPYGKSPWYTEGAEPGFAEDYRQKLTRLVSPQLSQVQQWLEDNPSKTVEDYLQMTQGIKAEYRQPQKPPAKVQEAQRKVEWEQLNKTVRDAKAKGIKYRPFSRKQDERWRVLNAEFGKEEKPAIWKSTDKSAYKKRDPKLEGHMSQKQWKELTLIGKPISKLPSTETLLQRNAIVSDLSDLGKKADSGEKNALIEERRMSLENERETLEAMGIDVNYLLKYLNTFQF